MEEKLLIDLRDLNEEGRRFRGALAPAVLELPDSPDVRVDGSVCYDLTARLVSGDLLVQGTLDVGVVFRCSRCLEDFPFAVHEPAFDAVYDEEQVAGAADETQCVDLTAEARESILVAFPSCPVCRPECRGLCPHCGINRNEGGCECRPPAESRWGALDALDL